MSRENCNTITGPAAEGDTYFPRVSTEKEILKQLRKGVFVHFTAPRRVGKTSVLKELANRDYDDIICTYQDIEAIQTSDKLYQRLIELMSAVFQKKSKLLSLVGEYLKSKKIKSISAEGVVLEHEGLDYKSHFLSLVDAIKQQDIKVILFLDEFPDVVNNIKINEGPKVALEVLHTLRECRHRSDFQSSLGIVFSGSVGLTHVVRSLGRSKLINDLAKVRLDPLTLEQLPEFIAFLTNGATLEVPDATIAYIEQRLQQLIPYYIQLIIDKGDVLTDEEDRVELTENDVDRVYDQLIKDSDNFIDWVDRIRDYYKDSYGFLKAALTATAHKEKGISIQEVLNIAEAHKEKEYEDLMHQVLIQDGYLFKGENGNYQFSSPLLRDWWSYHYSTK